MGGTQARVLYLARYLISPELLASRFPIASGPWPDVRTAARLADSRSSEKKEFEAKGAILAGLRRFFLFLRRLKWATRQRTTSFFSVLAPTRIFVLFERAVR